MAFMGVNVLVKYVFPWLILLPSELSTDEEHITGSARCEDYYKIDPAKKRDYLENIVPHMPPSTKEVISYYLLQYCMM